MATIDSHPNQVGRALAVPRITVPRLTTAAGWWPWVAAAGVAVLYLLSVRAAWNPTPDSALYLMLGENLVQGEGYTLWGYPHVHVPPGYPLLLAALTQLGLGSRLALNLAQTLIALTAIVFCYHWLREMADRRLAVAVSVAVALGYTLLWVSTSLLSDAPHLLAVWLGLFCCVRGLRGESGNAWLVLGVAALIASCWIRVAGVPLAFGAALGLVIQPRQVSRKRVWIAAGLLAVGVALTLGGFYIYCRCAHAPYVLPSYLDSASSSMTSRSAADWLSQPLENFLLTGSELSRLLIAQPNRSLGLVNALFWVPTLLGAWILVRRKEYLGVCVAGAYVGAILIHRPLIARYLLPIAPLLILYFCEGMRRLVEWNPLLRRWAPYSAVACALLLAAANLPKDVRYACHAGQPNCDEKQREQLASLRQTAEVLAQHARPGEKFISSGYQRELSYLSRMPSVPVPVRPLDAQPFQAEDFHRWRAGGVSFAVVVGDNPEPRYGRVLREDALLQSGFRLVTRRGIFQIYALRESMTQTPGDPRTREERLVIGRYSSNRPRANGRP